MDHNVTLSIFFSLTSSIGSPQVKKLVDYIANKFNGKITEFDSFGVKVDFPDLKSASKAEHVLTDYAKKHDLDIDAKLVT